MNQKRRRRNVATRREFLTALAGFGSSIAVSGCSSLTDTQAAPAFSQKLIDVHHHILPAFYMAEAKDRVVAQGQGYLPQRVLEWTPENALAEMDRNNVVTALLSISTPGIWFGDVQAARALARKCNEYAAELVETYPNRFGFFASVPLPDTEGSLLEIAYALDILKADGVVLLTSYGETWPGDLRYAAVFEELNHRKAVVYLHPTGPDCCRNLIPSVPYVFTELPHDTTRAITSLLFSGSFARFRDIRFIVSHAGGTLPMVAGRISRQSRSMRDLAEKVPKGVEYELRRLHYEIAGSANPPAMAGLMNLVPTTQIMFGSDYPWGLIGVTATGMAELGLSAADIRAIGNENAMALFPQLRTRQ
ncbi:MAG: amidohydrolase family protein [Gammaproteobacteria bacterium]